VAQADAAEESTNRHLNLEDTSSMTAEELAFLRYEQRKQQRRDQPRRDARVFVTSPAAASTDGLSLHQGRFDLASLYQEQLRTERCRVIVDFTNGRILFSNAHANLLFSNFHSLQQKEIVDLVVEDTRVDLSACIMYLSIGKFTAMDAIVVRIITGKGIVPALLTGENMVSALWWLDFDIDMNEVVTGF
ncbi:unnamed protein product, partial [Polarella glacialis]